MRRDLPDLASLLHESASEVSNDGASRRADRIGYHYGL
jgi:hypothetical protein